MSHSVSPSEAHVICCGCGVFSDSLMIVLCVVTPVQLLSVITDHSLVFLVMSCLKVTFSEMCVMCFFYMEATFFFQLHVFLFVIRCGLTAHK
jgi:hypothetical protein